MINGRAGSGKDQMADYLVEKYGFTKITFASPVYEIAKNYFGMTTKDRGLLQLVGQKLREIDSEVWVKFAFNEAKKFEKVVISDCRQENEYLLGVKNGFTPFRVHANLEDRISRCIERDGVPPRLSEWENASEVGADRFEYREISNHGTKEDFYKIIDYMMENN